MLQEFSLSPYEIVSSFIPPAVSDCRSNPPLMAFACGPDATSVLIPGQRLLEQSWSLPRYRKSEPTGCLASVVFSEEVG
jgi:hypothetical protein